jgi:hypothetical protein
VSARADALAGSALAAYGSKNKSRRSRQVADM